MTGDEAPMADDQGGPTGVGVPERQRETTDDLDVLLAAGLDAPYSCREGACSACGLKLLEGEVTMDNNSVLEDEDLEEGWRLGCQARSTGVPVKVSYDD